MVTRLGVLSWGSPHVGATLVCLSSMHDLNHRSQSCGAAAEGSPRREPWGSRRGMDKPRQGRQSKHGSGSRHREYPPPLFSAGFPVVQPRPKSEPQGTFPFRPGSRRITVEKYFSKIISCQCMYAVRTCVKTTELAASPAVPLCRPCYNSHRAATSPRSPEHEAGAAKTQPRQPR